MATTKRAKKTAATSSGTARKKAAAKKTTARKTTAKKARKARTASAPAAEAVPAPVEPPAAAVAPPPGDETRFQAMQPGARRAIFFDVENTSRAEDVAHVLEHLDIDFGRGPLEFLAVGNWRVIGHEPARQLAAKGAALVHSAPSTGVRDWSDLRIAVAAGVWLAGAVPGDIIEIVSDDQAFDAVGDVAASRGVTFRRLSYRSLAGMQDAPKPVAATPSSPRRRRRGGRRNGRRRSTAGGSADSPVIEVPPIAGDDEPDAQTAPVDEVVEVVSELMAGSPDGVTLDAIANALRARGFRRRSGSARLITRLKLIKDIEVGRDGKIRMPGAAVAAAESAPAEEAGEAATKTRRRRGRRGGRRRRGRRNGGGDATESAEAPLEGDEAESATG